MEGPTLKDVLKSEKHEDYVEYFVFPREDTFSSSEDPEEILLKLNAAAQKISGDYLWHCEPFVLRLGSKSLEELDTAEDEDEEEEVVRVEDANKGKGQRVQYLRGITRFGDNSDDEWFVVYILRELTKLFAGLVVRYCLN